MTYVMPEIPAGLRVAHSLKERAKMANLLNVPSLPLLYDTTNCHQTCIRADFAEHKAEGRAGQNNFCCSP
jgi:hypothetical protein